MSEQFTKCDQEDCAGYVCMFHSLRPTAQAHITKLEEDKNEWQAHAELNVEVSSEWQRKCVKLEAENATLKRENESHHRTIAGLAVALGCRDADLDLLRKDLVALKRAHQEIFDELGGISFDFGGRAYWMDKCFELREISNKALLKEPE